MPPINVTMPTIIDSSFKHFAHKVPSTAIKLADMAQELALDVPFDIISPITSTFMGNPVSLNLFLNSDTAVTVTVLLSPNGDFYFEYGTVVLAANGSSVTTIPGAGFVRLVPSVNIATFNAFVVSNS